ncbi:hypothetical protein KIN20_021313 [Parelaphostrongylus tenuis]|uniref:Phosducin thioredoxin-like domain-containing protein n=1 Tax=Parelaphostrongylus tenuis TaxID=148309 RepID=A0AAD5MSL7_PARTN|nr:hypothetical protein KIN20_021313 [Parelaphostrongylus tenuis]
MRHMKTPSTNTGVKGVLNEFAAEQERSMEKRKASDREICRMAQKGMLQGSAKELENDQIVRAMDTCDGLLCILIYKPDDEMCDKSTHSELALPTLQFYLNGVLVRNFLQISSLLGGANDVDSVKKFLRRQHIDLTNGTYTTDSECSNDEDID